LNKAHDETLYKKITHVPNLIKTGTWVKRQHSLYFSPEKDILIF